MGRLSVVALSPTRKGAAPPPATFGLGAAGPLPVAAGIGAVWIIGRIVYFIGYSQAAAKRGPGFAIQGIAAIALWAGALGAVVLRLV